MSSPTSTATPGSASATHALTVDDVMAGLRDQESGGNYHAQSSTETASGAYQYIDATWGGYGGYRHAKDAPPAVQDQKMRTDLDAAYQKFDGDWERVIAAHFVGDGGAEGSKSAWDQVPADSNPASHNPTIRSYVDSVLTKIQADTGGTLDGSGTSPGQITNANTDQLVGGGNAANGADIGTTGHTSSFAIDAGVPLNSGLDSDGDGLSDAYERSIGTNPFDADTDHDGLSDGLEVSLGTDPNNPDTDGDGRTDGAEVRFGSNPLVADAAPASFTPQTATTDPAGATGSATNGSATNGGVAGTTGSTDAGGLANASTTNTDSTGSTSATAAGVGSVTTASPNGASAHHSVQYMMDEALAQRGDHYVVGPPISMDDPNPTEFDCSKLTEWAAHQAGVEIPGTSYEQYLYLKQKGLLIPVDQAAHIKGALLFEFSSEPQPGQGAPAGVHHVALSMGDGVHDMEAKGSAYGVNEFKMGGRFTYAALLPGLDYSDSGGASTTVGQPADLTAVTASATGTPAGGLTVDDVMDGIRDQESGGNYGAHSSSSSASGAYQYIDSTWNNYGGYAHAKDAPPAVQDQRMRMDLNAAYQNFHGDWERVIAAHFVGAGAADGPKSEWDVHPGKASSNNPTIRTYVDDVLTHITDDTGATLTGTGITSTGATLTGTEPGAGTDTTAAAGHTAAFAMETGTSTSASAAGLDSDHDGLTDAFERSIGTDPFNPDSDHDGLTDGYEVMHSHTNPLDADSDHDGLTDSFEVSLGTDPNDPDSDHDGFTDGYEVQHGTNPLGSGPLGSGSPLSTADVAATPGADPAHHAVLGSDFSWH